MPSRIEFRTRYDSLRTALEERADLDTESPGLTARRDLQRYYALLSRVLDAPYTRAEANVLIDALNGIQFDADTIHRVRVEVLAADQALLDKHSVDRGVLAAKLDGRPLLSAATVDAVERFWLDPTQDPSDVGLCPPS